ncbi:MAG: ATP synthase F1 subunit epsilon [Helicobacteraceae bacterium]
MDKISIEIITPEGLIFSGEALSITMPGIEGEFGVLPGHASLVSLLGAGVIEIQLTSDLTESVAIDSGYAEVSPDKVDILAEGAVAITGESDSEIARAITAAKELLNSAKSDVLMTSLEAKIETAAKKRY